jgi:hypothetical protein
MFWLTSFWSTMFMFEQLHEGGTHFMNHQKSKSPFFLAWTLTLKSPFRYAHVFCNWTHKITNLGLTLCRQVIASPFEARRSTHASVRTTIPRHRSLPTEERADGRATRHKTDASVVGRHARGRRHHQMATGSPACTSTSPPLTKHGTVATVVGEARERTLRQRARPPRRDGGRGRASRRVSWCRRRRWVSPSHSLAPKWSGRLGESGIGFDPGGWFCSGQDDFRPSITIRRLILTRGWKRASLAFWAQSEGGLRLRFSTAQCFKVFFFCFSVQLMLLYLCLMFCTILYRNMIA